MGKTDKYWEKFTTFVKKVVHSLGKAEGKAEKEFGKGREEGKN